MRIVLVTPASVKSTTGNRTTATRWARILKSLGHHVVITTAYAGQPADVLIALHAWRSAKSVEDFANINPKRPIILAITGTDAYQFIDSHAETTLRSIHLADHLIGLHDLIGNALPSDQQHKLHVIYQSADTLIKRKPYQRYFHVSVMGHLRDEKDPIRPALAARKLPIDSAIKIHHYGKAYTNEWASRANTEMATNLRYQWHGGVARHQIKQVYQRTNLLVLPSRMEGGANVISEAVVAGVPVIASKIEGSVGLLGKDYCGYYPVADEQALCELLIRAENDPVYYHSLIDAGRRLQSKFGIKRETDAWADVLNQL